MTRVQVNGISIELYETTERMPPDRSPVLVSGGIAKRINDKWYTGMEEPLFSRELEWEPSWWMHIPYTY